MEFKRAQEILNMTQSITIFHKGTSIWIESLDPITQTAMVRSDLGPMQVPVMDLIEVH